MRPALVLDPDHGLRIVTEEQFGPALPVIPYDDEEQAIAQANDTWSGLCSSVWSDDPEHAMAVARRLRTGVTFFNNHNATAVDERAPFGGFNQSGVGRELGREGLLAFTETHVMSVPCLTAHRSTRCERPCSRRSRRRDDLREPPRRSPGSVGKAERPRRRISAGRSGSGRPTPPAAGGPVRLVATCVRARPRGLPVRSRRRTAGGSELLGDAEPGRELAEVGSVASAHERDPDPGTPGARCAAEPVDISLVVVRRVEVDDVRDPAHVDAAGGDVGSDQRVDMARCESCKAADAGAAIVAVDRRGRDAVGTQARDEPVGAALGPDEHERERAVCGELFDEGLRAILLFDRDKPMLDLDRGP